MSDATRRYLQVAGELPQSPGRPGSGGQPPLPARRPTRLYPHRERRTIHVDLATARTDAAPMVVSAAGTVLYVGHSSSVSAWCKVQIDGRGDYVPFARGRGEAEPFSVLKIINDAQAGAWIILVYLTDDPDDPARINP